MKTFYKITGVIFIIGCFFFIKYNYYKICTYKNGTIVYATIVYLPNCTTTKQHYNLKFNYQGKLYAKGIGVSSCKELNEGDLIKLKTNKDNSIFLYEYENPYYNMISFILLILFGVFLIYLGFKK